MPKVSPGMQESILRVYPRHGRPRRRPSLLTRAPLDPEGGYSPMTTLRKIAGYFVVGNAHQLRGRSRRIQIVAPRAYRGWRSGPPADAASANYEYTPYLGSYATEKGPDRHRSGPFSSPAP